MANIVHISGNSMRKIGKMFAPTIITDKALADVREVFHRWEFWVRLGAVEVRRRYRRTYVGPFWVSISMAIFIAATGIVYSLLFQQEIKQYIPFLASGMIAWTPISSIMTESCVTFVSAEGILKQIPLPYTVLIAASIWRNLIVFFHNFIIYCLVVLLFDVPVNANTLLIVFGILSYAINGMWIALLIAIVCARYRDIQPLLVSALQILMFVTPIFWPASMLEKNLLGKICVWVNPFYHLTQVIRAPLLGECPQWFVYVSVTLLAVFGWLFTLVLFSKVRQRIIYWL